MQIFGVQGCLHKMASIVFYKRKNDSEWHDGEYIMTEFSSF